VTGAKNIVRTYDDAGRVLVVDDVTTGTTTTYTYDLAGRRKTEVIMGRDFSNALVTLRSLSYTYDGASNMIGWADAVTGKSLSYEYDAAGNQVRVWGSDSTDHHYAYDANDRLVQLTQGAATLLAAYGYDAVGRRITYGDGTNTSTFTYDSENRVVRADITKNTTPGDTSDDTHARWEYDAAGQRDALRGVEARQRDGRLLAVEPVCRKQPRAPEQHP
jgi:YD repeat-containing protein